MDHTQLVQDTLSDSKLIFERIRLELLHAKREILVAMAWFTDRELFQILEDRLVQNIKVSIIISEQVDNEKLDFAGLQSQGADVIKVKNVGWGMMNQKFCVIDREVAITGSYNWTNNAKNNNHETVVVTNYAKTVTELVDTFQRIHQRAIRINNGESLADIMDTDDAAQTLPTDEKQPIAMDRLKLDFYEQSLKDYKDVLDSIIATEVGAFDKDLLKASGYNRAMENNGDHQILPQAMDSLYSNFINEIEVIEEKKIRLRARIEEQRKVSVANIELKAENEINNLRQNGSVAIQNMDADILELASTIAEKRHTIASIAETKIPYLQERVSAVKAKIKELQIAFVKPPLNWPATLTLGLMTIILGLYIFVFYSSVAYIFIFSKEDIKMMLTSGAAVIEAPEVFNPHAITKIWQKGSGGIMFLFLFVAIPLALGMYKVFLPAADAAAGPAETKPGKLAAFGRWLTKHIGMLLIIIVDIFIAYKVAININDVEFITGDTDLRIGFFDVLGNGNFWLVFALGALGVYLFSFFFEKVFKLLNDRTATHHQEKVKHEVAVLDEQMNSQLAEINTLQLASDTLHAEVSTLSVAKEEKTRQRQQQPIQANDALNSLRQRLLSYKEHVANIGNTYISQIDNDKLPISKSEMENRVNIYMEGWSKYLYQDYSVMRAETKTREAITECEAWLARLSLLIDFGSEISDNYLVSQN